MDLRLHLMLRIALTAVACLAVAAVAVLVRADRELREASVQAAENVARLLEVQAIERGVGLSRQGSIANLAFLLDEGRNAGQCIRYVNVAGDMVENSCHGWDNDKAIGPQWFARLFRWAFGTDREIKRSVMFRNAKQGEVVVSPDPQREIAHAWRDLKPMLGLATLTVLALCTMTYFVIGRALRPTREILAGLERLERGDLGSRMPGFKLVELNRISAVFNRLAESLQQSIAARAALTRKLVNVQEEERRFLARELHDEFGQYLTAMNAMAAVATDVARQECPAFSAQSEKISSVIARMMEVLKSLLVRLRPPGIDELGLIESLKNLVAGWNHDSGGRTQFDLQLASDVAHLPEPLGVNIYRIVQECLTNAAKHAGASKVLVRVQRHPPQHLDGGVDQIDVTVEDNGTRDISMDLAPGMGLLGMRERIAALGGQLELRRQQDRGLTVHALIPMPTAAFSSAPG